MTNPTLGYTAKIVPELEPLARPITDAAPHPKNVRKHSIEKIAQSLEQHGQRAPIVVQSSTGLIVKGNGTHAAATLLGWDVLAQVWQEMTDDEALAFLYADNRTSDLATYDRKKLRDGLKEMLKGPGLFDSLWEVAEFEDLDEELNGATVLAQQESGARYADDGVENTARKERAALPGEKMREVPLVLTIADHAMFVERLKVLQRAFGTTGTIATVAEAIKRQAEAEAAGTQITGRALDDGAQKAIRYESLKELRDTFTSLPDEAMTRSRIYSILQHALEANRPPAAESAVLPGQASLFAEELA